MKKSIIILGAVISGMIIPLLGMTIAPTRNLIIGLAPEDAVLQLADRIDENRNESNSKTQELQSLIDIQQNQITEQNIKIVEQQQSIDSQSTTIQTVQTEAIENEVYCQTNADKYTEEAYKRREKHIEDTRNSCTIRNDKDEEACDKAVSKAKNSFEEFKNEYIAYKNKCN